MNFPLFGKQLIAVAALKRKLYSPLECVFVH